LLSVDPPTRRSGGLDFQDFAELIDVAELLSAKRADHGAAVGHHVDDAD
jgi:hypothetical protein